MSKEYRPPRGFRDFPPEVMILRKELISKIENVFKRYGFDPLDTPAVEYWETLAGKYGEEAENRLIWKFKDPWSDREYALRYDLTVPLARFVSSHPEIQMPFKRYQISPVWRHEEPQKGRYREFYQCDADIVGSPYPEADAEMINLIVDSIKSLGFESGFSLRLNDRRLLSGIFEQELNIKSPLAVYRIIDKLDKIGIDNVKKELLEQINNEEIVNKIIEVISLSGKPEEILENLYSKYGRNKLVNDAYNHLKEMLDLINNKNDIIIDLSLVRGLDYYTGPIYEVVLKEPKIGSVSGGGRYDNLAGIFSGKQIPATGGSIGIERIIDAGLELGLFNLNKKTFTEIQVIFMSQDLFKHAWHIANILRSEGYNVRIDLNRSKEELQRRKANKLDIKLLIFIGKKEIETNTVTIYNTKTNERANLNINELKDKIKQYL
ncbi:histidyl-tRNA synthetase [Caldisphaera lagunensis DSM 15908]|uniref:Histidine--tRNA ligase n=1 Tax=Caldisphaera lagunensis (strain DSM 15908 / JCM 11604 / ANMR 0165 / IC-154) TaxID=1056495 RepID=L0ABH4_CALLD|nr:histidine--tRNA ligase [Caldisphaera lagunensis]AFZ71248.1 histidyl-tRNA synthetase [Caldisphaera lagunensis DSM 15908]